MTATAVAAPRRAGPLAAFDALLARRVSIRALAVLRVLAGPIVLLHLQPFLRDVAHRITYRDAFYEPYASWYPELPRPVYAALLWLGAGAAVAMALGVFTRAATATTLGVVTYNLFLSTTNYHSNRAFLVVVLACLTLAPTGRELSVDARWRRRRGLPAWDRCVPAWPLWLLRFEVAVVYGASGLSKLLDPDWFGGDVSWLRVVHARDRLTAGPVPGWAISVLSDRSFHTVAAKVIVATELFIALGLWWRTTRYAAVWVGVCFHVAIQLTAAVQIFSYLGIAALVIWATPCVRDRVLTIDAAEPRHQRFAALVRALDWLARFRIVPGPPGSPLELTDRDGTVSGGRTAVVRVLSRLPLTAWFALPFLRRARRLTKTVPREA